MVVAAGQGAFPQTTFTGKALYEGTQTWAAAGMVEARAVGTAGQKIMDGTVHAAKLVGGTVARGWNRSMRFIASLR